MLGEYECSSLALNRGMKKIEDEIRSLKIKLYNSALFIARTGQSLLWAVLAIPDISGGHLAYQGPPLSRRSNFSLFVGKERVHDYRLGIKSYQIKINITAPTLTVLGIENLKPYTIITHPFINIVNENSKHEKRVMDIEELPKKIDATLKKVLKKVWEIDIEV
ncbi:hypothetical protein Tco_0681533 [Tanacetum coccineum]|uniref:Uncharacterized protein n=1 Tax=Tanacetum coccineum TaxID=301880 RepID=A0ABQ4XNL3_9ASTR